MEAVALMVMTAEADTHATEAQQNAAVLQATVGPASVAAAASALRMPCGRSAIDCRISWQKTADM